MMQTVPIIITFSTWLTFIRIFLAPCVMAAIYRGAWIAAGVFFIVAAATDFLDGYYARLYGQETELGRVLDPVADKILIFSTLWALYSLTGQSMLPSWFIILLAGKDLILVGGGIFLIVQKKYTRISPSLLAKVVTALLMIFIVYLILIHYGIMSAEYVDQSIQFFTISTIIILLDYSYKFYQRLQGMDV